MSIKPATCASKWYILFCNSSMFNSEPYKQCKRVMMPNSQCGLFFCFFILCFVCSWLAPSISNLAFPHFLGVQPWPNELVKMLSWSVTGIFLSFPVLSLSSFVTSRGLLELKWASCAKASSRRVGHTKGQASRRVETRTTEVKSWTAGCTEA